MQLRATLEWTARVLAVLFVLFVSAFALDVFNQKDWLLGLIIHLVPSYILIAFTIVAWHNKLVGGSLFVIASAIFMVVSHFEAAVIYVPALVIGLLFVLSWYLKR